MSRQNKQDPNYETILTMSKNFTEISSMTETNSEHITSLISLIKSQNKSLQSLQQQVYKLQSKIGEEDDAECSDTEEDEEKIQVSEVFCDLCEDQHIALYHCKDCSENLCETIAGIHKKGKATKGHLVLLLSDMKNEANVDGSYEVPIYKENRLDYISSRYKSIISNINTSDQFDFTKNDLTFSIDLSTDIKPPKFDSGKISVKGEIFIVDIANHIVKVFSGEGKFIRTIGKPAKHILYQKHIGHQPQIECDNGEFDFTSFHNEYTYETIIQSSNIIYLCDKGQVFIRDFNKIQVFSQEGLFLYKVYHSHSNIKRFSVSSTGEVIVTHSSPPNDILKVLEITGKYTRKPKQTHFTLNTTLVQDSEILKDTKVNSVTFPISIKRDANDNLFTRTLYFPQPIPVKQAIHEVEEYFRKRISREEFNEVRSVCNFFSLQGEIRGDYMNWDACKKAKIIRGYFLGGEIIQELRLNEGNLFIHITDCFVSLDQKYVPK
jgi:hypothetical protein